MILPSYDKPLPAFSILASDKLCCILGRRVCHEVIDDTELATCTITAGTKKLINDFRRNIGFSGKNSIHVFLDLPSLLCSRRQVRKGDDRWNRKSRGPGVLCFGYFLYFSRFRSGS